MGSIKKTSHEERWGFGFDPSINHSAWAVVSQSGRVHCGMIWNTYNEKPINHWAKLAAMVECIPPAIGAVRRDRNIPHPCVWVVEGQYTARGKGSPDIQVRNGWIAATAYEMGRGVAPRHIAMPHSWTGRDKKEDRIALLKNEVDQPSEWTWHSAIPPQSLMHNVWDAIGLALWGLKL